MTSEMTLGELAIRVLQMERRIDQGITRGLRDAVGQLHAQVQQMFGHYQDGYGPFPAWAPLEKSTIERKQRPDAFPEWGDLPDAPLVRSADLALSYRVSVEGHEASIGSDSEYALIHETGGFIRGHYIPQRATLGLAFVKYERKIFARFNSTAWYEVMSPNMLHSVIFDDDPYDNWDGLDNLYESGVK